MTPEKFAKIFLALEIPLTEEEWQGLIKLFEDLQPGITAYITTDSEVSQQDNAANGDKKCEKDIIEAGVNFIMDTDLGGE